MGIKTEEFKKNEGLAQKVMDILFSCYVANTTPLEVDESPYNSLELIKWSIEDYESCGFNMKKYKGYYNILEKQKERKLKRLRGSN